ncbi:hypothetical protein [Ectopseudomonas khazarica]|uniref:hypothetical protein n=2 Tax=Bacteria TaxID=2 RepID=UPI0037CC6504
MNDSFLEIENSAQTSAAFQKLSKNTDIASIISVIEGAGSLDDAKSVAILCAKRLDRVGYKYGYDTLRDIILSANNTSGIKKIFIDAFEGLVSAQTAKLSSMLKPAATHKINYSGLALKDSLALVGKMGEGKNVLCMEPWFEKAMKDGQKPAFVAPLRSLISKFTASPEHYEAPEDYLMPRQGLRTTAHSFVSDKFTGFRESSEVIFFDEFVRMSEVIHSSIWGDGGMDSKISGWKEVVSAAKRASHVVLSDAHLGQAYIDIFEGLTGKSFPAYEPLVSTYSDTNIEYGYSHESLIEKTLRAVSHGEKTGFFFDGRIDEGKAIEASLKASGIKAIFLHSADKVNVDSKVYEASIDSNTLDEFDVVICSPAIGPGWSCVLPRFTEVMIDCCGTISPASTLQCIKRFRAVKNVSIAFSLNSSRSSARRNLPETASNVAFYKASEEFIDEAVDHDTAFKRSLKILNDKYGNAICEMIALENWSRNNYESCVVRGLEILGFNVRFGREVATSETKVQKKLCADAIKSEKRAFFRNDKMLDERELQSAISSKLKSGADQNAEWLIEKSMAAQTMGVSKLSEEDVEFVIDQKGIEILKRIDLIAGNGKVNLSNDVKICLFKDVLGFAANKSVISADGIDDFIKTLKANKLRWNGKYISKFTLISRTLFEIKGAGSKNMIAVKGMLALLGIKLRSPKNREAGKYLLDSSVHDRAVSYLKNIQKAEEARSGIVTEWKRLFAS